MTKTLDYSLFHLKLYKICQIKTKTSLANSRNQKNGYGQTKNLMPWENNMDTFIEPKTGIVCDKGTCYHGNIHGDKHHSEGLPLFKK